MLLMTLILGMVVYWDTEKLIQAGQYEEKQSAELILDAGHGGEDGGALSISGVSESQINLEIVQKIDDLLGLYGASPVLLRRTDTSLHSKGANTLHEKKVSDLKNRVEAIQSNKGTTLISIHQNTYPTIEAKGLQAFYAPTEGSKELAELIQKSVQETLQKENKRTARQISKSVYLMNHVSCRAVLIECGFLTHPQEERDLLDHMYQRKLAAVLACAWLNSREVQ